MLRSKQLGSVKTEMPNRFRTIKLPEENGETHRAYGVKASRMGLSKHDRLRQGFCQTQLPLVCTKRQIETDAVNFTKIKKIALAGQSRFLQCAREMVFVFRHGSRNDLLNIAYVQFDVT